MFIIFIITGILSGIISGLGIGGGTLLIPVLTIFFAYTQQQAQIINLIYFIPTAVSALYSHNKNGNLEKGIVLRIVLFGLIGSVGGSLAAVWISSQWLKRGFGIFLLAMGVYEVYKGWKTKS